MTKNTYYANGQLRSVRDASGALTSYGFERDELSAGHYGDVDVTSVPNPAASAESSSMTATRVHKDALGRSIETDNDFGTPGSTATGDDLITRTVYGLSGETPAVLTPIATTRFTDDGTAGGAAVEVGAGHVEIEYAQRKRSDVESMAKATIRLFDAEGRLSDVWLGAVDDPSTPSVIADEARPRWHYDYDTRGNEIAQVDPNDHTTRFAYDEEERRIGRTLPATLLDGGIGVVLNGRGGESGGGGVGTINAGPSESWTYDGFGRTQTHIDFA